MTPEQRKKLLESLAKSSQGEAVKDLINEKISELRDVTKLPQENLEVQARANVAAIAKLKQIIHLITPEQKEIGKNQYR